MLPDAHRHLSLARLHRARERWPETLAEAEAALAAGAGLDARRLLAGAAQRLDQDAKGARVLREVLGELEEEDIWRMIVLATSAEDWDTVRAGSAKLGIPIESTEGPIDQ